MTCQKGFTLMEMMLAIAIACVVMAGLASVFQNQQKTRSSQKQVLAMHQNLRSAMYLLAQEIRKAGYNPPESPVSSTGFTMIHKGSSENNDPGKLAFTYYDKKNNRLHEARIRLFDSANDPGNTKDEIQMRKGGQSIAENIESMTFAFLDKNGNETTDMNQIHAVRVFLTARSDETTSVAAEPQTLSMTVFCRNMEGTP